MTKKYLEKLPKDRIIEEYLKLQEKHLKLKKDYEDVKQANDENYAELQYIYNC